MLLVTMAEPRLRCHANVEAWFASDVISGFHGGTPRVISASVLCHAVISRVRA